MRLRKSNTKFARAALALTCGACLLLLTTAGASGAGRGRQAAGRVSREYSEARELFERLWQPGVASPGGGDGVGPLYNAPSCVGCHHQGGTGGAGPNSKNVTLLSAVPGAPASGDGSRVFEGELEALHPGFRNRSTIVLHRHATSEPDEERLAEARHYAFVQTRDDAFALKESQRSTPALFGAGRIDAVSDEALLAAARRTFPAFPEIKGRVSRLRDGRLGKFGWKGQTASLDDFVMAACANELGLEVRGHHQPSLLSMADYDPKRAALDLSNEEAASLVRFVAGLPPPVVRNLWTAERGLAVFKNIGCATCHAPDLGRARGLYSDLLLHDLGDRILAFGGGYGSSKTELVDRPAGNHDAPAPSEEARPTEWRTTPLWGVADSAPYLHDGRASTLHEAILLHGGEADLTSKRYAALAFEDRQALLAFLHSQVAPPQPGRAGARGPRGKRASSNE